MKKRVPRLQTDKQAGDFLAQDLSNLDFSQFKRANFEFKKTDEPIDPRVRRKSPQLAKDRVKARRKPPGNR